jgi:hypothetical protein
MLRPVVVTAFAVLLLASACTDNSVTLVSSDKIAAFKAGSTNQTEVVATLGKPLHTIIEADGTKIDQYPTEAGASGGSIIPDWLGGGAPQSYGMVSFLYGSGGTLKDIKTAK